ncbi:MAG: NADH-quinone oxidoreductase subunit NuoG [Bacteroidota bacterium]
MATIYIDNKPFEVSSGKNLLETCLTLGLNLPYFCWHPALGSVGACRQCAVKVFKDENDKKGRLIMSCMEPVTNNQRISITDFEAKEFREHVIGWLMTNHPHDCAVCDEGGSCHLQDMTVMTGHAYRQFNYKKRTYKNQYLGPFINHEMNRCIQCYRCVRFYKDYAGGKDLDAFASRNNVYFGRHEDGVLESEFSGNLAEVCPTGVFTDKTLKQHYTRKWDLTMAPSICQHCSVGCNIIAGERYNSLRSITSRYNGEVNGYFLCDRGRFGYEFVNAPSRVRIPVVQNGVSAEVTLDKLLKEISSLKNSNIIGIGSPRASIESNFALKKLVGDDNYFQGISEKEFLLANLVVNILSKGPARSYSLKEVEQADAVFVLGEDLTNTAPMLALAIRQSVKQQPMKDALKASIPSWHDAAARELIQENKGPLFIASLTSTKLDDVATHVYHASPENIARLGFAVANGIDPSAPLVTDLTSDEQTLAQNIAKALMNAERPVIISGTSNGSEELLHASSNIATALHKKNSKTGIVLTLPDCNSMGLSMLGGNSLNKAIEAVQMGKVETVIVLENDLYRHADAASVDQFFSSGKKAVVIDHTVTSTTKKATVLIPTGTFAEADGTLVNNEGRAQRFFQVYEPANGSKESWRWLIQMGECLERKGLSHWKNHGDVVQAIVDEVDRLKGVEKISPDEEFRISGQKIPREPHRYSGRTAMNANINVSEPKPPEDPDSPLSYTMEGLRAAPPSAMIPFFWSPGWNSVQSINKYQEEVGGALRGGDPGIRLIEPKENSTPYFTNVPPAFKPRNNEFYVVPLHHIFGSEELSSLSPGIAERSPKPYIAMCHEDASRIGKEPGEMVTVTINSKSYQLPLIVNQTISNGLVGLPVGLSNTEYFNLPDWTEIK